MNTRFITKKYVDRQNILGNAVRVALSNITVLLIKQSAQFVCESNLFCDRFLPREDDLPEQQDLNKIQHENFLSLFRREKSRYCFLIHFVKRNIYVYRTDCGQ